MKVGDPNQMGDTIVAEALSPKSYPTFLLKVLINTMKTTLLIDSNYICYRAMLTMRELSYDTHSTGVIFGFLRQLQTLANKFNYPRFIFVWDSAKSFRKMVYPGYKQKSDRDIDPELENIIKQGKPQFGELRSYVLPCLGFNNNLIQTGLEADDIIAWLVRNCWESLTPLYIVTGDNDLYQLLTSEVIIYDPRGKSFYSEDDFIREKGITPDKWPWVKAVGGCNSDKVRGVPGVAEISALKYLKGQLTGKKRQAIEEFNPSFNLELVRLPHHRTSPIKLVEDELRLIEFEGICLYYGLNSFLRKDNDNQWRKILNG